MHIRSKVVHISSKPRQSRERSACPKCESIYVKRRVRTRDYVCKSCGWEGFSIKKVMY